MNSKVVVILSCVAILIACCVLLSHWNHQHPPAEKTYFYDLSEEELFAGPLVAIPPIQGINDLERDGFRAMVISFSGDSSDKSGRIIAYIEKYSDQFKQQVEAKRRGEIPVVGTRKIGRGAAQAHTFVRRLTDAQWYPRTSPEAIKIIGEWRVKDSNGKYPVVCNP
jgi:hypothetical protein